MLSAINPHTQSGRAPGVIQRNYRELGALGLVLVIYLAVLWILPKDVFWSPDEGIRLIMARMLAAPTQSGPLWDYPGYRLDPGHEFHPSVFNEHVLYPRLRLDGSRMYPWPVWFPLLAGWLYRLFGYTGLYILPAACGWLACLVGWRLAQRLAPSLAALAIVLIGLGTPIFFYSLTFWDNTLVVCMALLATWLAMDAQDFTSPRLWLSLLLMAGATALRIEMAALMLALGLSWGITSQAGRRVTQSQAAHRRAGSTTLWRSLLVLLAVLAFLGLFFRSGLVTPRHIADLRHVLRDLTRLEATQMVSMVQEAAGVLVNSPAAEGLRLPQPWTWLGLAALLALVLAGRTNPRRWELAVLLPALAVWVLLPVLAFASRQPYRSLHGVLLTAPYAAFIAFSLRGAWSYAGATGGDLTGRPARLILLTTVSYAALGLGMILLFRGMTPQNRFPGLEWGQRYLLPLYPLLVLSTMMGLRWYLETRPGGWGRSITVALLGLTMISSIYIQGRGVLMLYQTRQGLSHLAAELEGVAPDPIVTDLWWLPASLAGVFTSQELYSVRDIPHLERWLKIATEAGVQRFTLLTASPALIETVGDHGWRLRGSNMKAFAGVMIARFESSGSE